MASDAKLKDGVGYKPLIVGNPHCDKPLDERGEVLAPNAATYASNGGVVVIKTIQLFEALRQKQAGTFDEARFWRTVFETSGPADLDEPSADETGGTNATWSRRPSSARREPHNPLSHRRPLVGSF